MNHGRGRTIFGPTKNLRAQHAENHSDMSHDEEEPYESRVELELPSFVPVFPNEAKLKECDATEWNDSSQIGEDSDHVRRSAPEIICREWNHGTFRKTHEYGCEVDPGCDSSEATDVLHSPSGFPREEEVEFSDGDSFSEDDRYGHVDDQVPRLIGRQELHVMCHVHSLG